MSLVSEATVLNISICGIVGIPGNYGGFETFAEFLVKHSNKKCKYTVYCDRDFSYSPEMVPQNCKLIKLPLKANGAQSIIFDALAMLIAAIKGDRILLLGCSGGWMVPLLRLFGVKIVTNIAGLEWSRAKWGKLASYILKSFEKLAVKYSTTVVTDNKELTKYVYDQYGIESSTIAYGGDHLPKSIVSPVELSSKYQIPIEYFVSVGRCQPDNNIEEIIRAFISTGDNLVSISNWNNSEYGRRLKEKYSHVDNIFLLDPIYDLEEISSLRVNAIAYVHGHSAGGTNPTLVEAMWLKVPIISYDVSFNRCTTDNNALFWSSVEELRSVIDNLDKNLMSNNALKAFNYAESFYSWNYISNEYLKLFME